MEPNWCLRGAVFWFVLEITYLRLYKCNIMTLDQAFTQTVIRTYKAHPLDLSTDAFLPRLQRLTDTLNFKWSSRTFISLHWTTCTILMHSIACYNCTTFLGNIYIYIYIVVKVNHTRSSKEWFERSVGSSSLVWGSGRLQNTTSDSRISIKQTLHAAYPHISSIMLI